MKNRNMLLFAALTWCGVALGGKPAVERIPFGTLSTGEAVTLYRIRNASGAWMDVIDYGCRVVSINVPDRNGTVGDVVPGYDNLNDFEHGSERFFGALIGRYGNRIAEGSFMLDGKLVQLSQNETLAGHAGHIHGGFKGFDRVVWQARPVVEKHRAGVVFTRLSPDGEEGYPGNLDCTVSYWFDDDNVWKAEYEATTDAPTIVNMSNHTYFNLHGANGGYVMSHLLQVDADYYLPNTPWFTPIGLKEPVDKTPFDFREPATVDHALDTPSDAIITMRGFSNTWVLRDYDGTLRRVADLYDPESGRGIELHTTEPGLLTFTGRTLDKQVGKEGKRIKKYGGMLLETLHFADSPNNPKYPSTVLRPGERYYSSTEFRFYAK
jgi:aldose 1-epimerase